MSSDDPTREAGDAYFQVLLRGHGDEARHGRVVTGFVVDLDNPGPVVNLNLP